MNLPSRPAVSREIRSLARKAAAGLASSAPAFRVAQARARCPVDYMRCAEFDAVLRQIAIRPGMLILDVASPQWFSLLLAARHPEARFVYVNILPDEVHPFAEIARQLGLANLSYAQQDVRELAFPRATFDLAVSISALEHVAPEEDGDQRALGELRRVLKPAGELALTLPFKAQRGIVYLDGPVYERAGAQHTFFAREYDDASFRRLVARGGFAPKDVAFVCERRGLLSLDYWEWGPGRHAGPLRHLPKLKRIAERTLGVSLDGVLAERYLRVSPEVSGRVVNVAAVLAAPP